MNDQILVPVQSALRGTRQGRDFPFWHNSWGEISRSIYEAHVETIKDSIAPIIDIDISSDQNIYTEVVLSDKATAKTTTPSEIWKNSDLEIVETSENNTITISGKKSDYEALSAILDDGSYDTADEKSSASKSERNMSRELMAVSSFGLKSSDPNKRMDRALVSHFEDASEQNQTVDCFIELYADTTNSDYDTFFDVIKDAIGSGKLLKEDEEAFINNKFFRARLNQDEIYSLLSDSRYLFIRVIRLVPQFTGQRSASSASLNTVSVAPPETSQIFGVIDSGIDHALINTLVSQREKLIPSSATEDKNHGTFVASRALFGDNIYEIVTSSKPVLTPIGRCIDLQVMYKDRATGEPTVDTVDLIKHIKDMVRRYPDIKIYNLSLSSREISDDRFPSMLTELLDKFAREEDVLFVCCTGNQKIFVGEITDDKGIFEDCADDVRILSPGDAVSVLTVGARAQKTDTAAISKNGHPSPFTRSGYIRKTVKKPELVANGGNYLKETVPSRDADVESELSRNTYGVSGLDTSGVNRDLGTSEATPLVTREAVRAFDFIQNSSLSTRFNLEDNKMNLTRALLVHSTAFDPMPSITNEFARRAYGYGMPAFSNLEHDGPDRVTIMYADKIYFNEKKHRLQITLPDFTKTSKTQFIFTLAYNPPVNKNYDEYNMMGITANLKTVIPRIDEKGRTVFDPVDGIKPSKDWTRVGINHQDQSSTISHIKVNKDRLGSVLLEALIQLWVNPEYEKKIHVDQRDKQQPYSLVLTIIDREERGLLRNELMASNQFSVVNRNEIEIEI